MEQKLSRQIFAEQLHKISALTFWVYLNLISIVLLGPLQFDFIGGDVTECIIILFLH